MAKTEMKLSKAQERNVALSPPERLKLGLEHLARLRTAMTAQIFTILDEVNEMKGQVDLDVDLMMRDGGFTDAEISTYVNFAPLNNHKKIIKKNNVSFEAIRGLLRADEDSLQIALRSIERDPTLSYDQIIETIERLRNDSLPLHEKVFRASELAFAEAFSQSNEQRKISFRSKASELYGLMTKFSRLQVYLDRNPNKRVKLSTSPHYAPFAAIVKALEDQLAAAAGELFTELKLVFPGCERPIEDWAFIALEKPADAYLAQAHFSLDMMSRRLFHKHLPGEHTSYYSWSSYDAIRFLSGIKCEKDKRKAPQLHPRDIRKLNAIDICAGSGGQALGLEAAGFNIRGLVDFDRKRLQTLARNRTRWNVFDCDLSSPLTHESIQAWRGDENLRYSLDLVSGSLPIGPWAYRGNGIGELFTATRQIIASLQPKAFFFETDEGFKAERHKNFRLSLRQYFKTLGYRTYVWKLGAHQLGLPQKRTRFYLVGIKHGYGQLLPPQMNIEATLGMSIWSAAFPDLSEYTRHLLQKRSGENVVKIDLNKARQALSPLNEAYDVWAANWIKRYNKPAPDLGKNRVPIVGAAAKAWGDAGFQPQLLAPPSINDPYFDLVSDKNALKKASKRPKHPKVAMDASVLRLLQGIPSDWEFEGDETSQVQEISSMRPPLMSLAIARQIHNAITGQSVNLNHPETRKITSGRDRLLPSFVNNDASHPDPLRYRAQMWAYSKIDEANIERSMAFEDDDDGE